MSLCEALLEEAELDAAVRTGDVYGLIVEIHCQQGRFQQVGQTHALPPDPLITLHRRLCGASVADGHSHGSPSGITKSRRKPPKSAQEVERVGW